MEGRGHRLKYLRGYPIGTRGFAFRESAEVFAVDAVGKSTVKHRGGESEGSSGDLGLPREGSRGVDRGGGR